MKKEWLLNAGVAVMVLCALTITGLVVRQQFFAPEDAVVRIEGYVQNWQAYAAGGHRMGPEQAPVTLVEFSDFECPACRVLAGTLRELRQRHPAQVAVVYRHAPLRIHRFARPAARAAECAAEQGRFEAYHDALFSGQSSFSEGAWTRFAGEAGVRDPRAFTDCLRVGGGDAALARDTADAAKLGVLATPTLLVNGARITGAAPLPFLEQMVAREAAAQRSASR
jgi:protein-disulfide isomerase